MTTVETAKQIPNTDTQIQESRTSSEFVPSISHPLAHPPDGLSQTPIPTRVYALSERSLEVSEGDAQFIGRMSDTASLAGASEGTIPMQEKPVFFRTGRRSFVRVERDYSRGDVTQFSIAFPVELAGRLPKEQFERTITIINQKLEIAERPLFNFIDALLGCMTATLSAYLFSTHYRRTVREIRKFIETENDVHYHPLCLNIIDPTRTAFLFLEIEIY
ncbi:uncharacterized protein VTP21DRAFT_5538 [Calcarisporiella thermophila]|uniref:uncharacterized protein n=1 Tax=Calcarisporiella thermophila TaxID=911321 RepID=UPI003742C76A